MAAQDPHEFGTPKLYVEHIPDPEADVSSDAYDTDDALTGFVDVGVVVDGVKIPLTREKAGWVNKRLKQAQAAKSSGNSSNG